MTQIFSKDYNLKKEAILFCINNFNSEGILFGNGKRNKIKIFDLDGTAVNIKSFKIPNLINMIDYKFFRKSKPKRSYAYAHT